MSEYPQAGNDPREGLFEHDQFLGLRNNVGEESFGLGDLTTALNCDIDDALVLRRRKGYSAPVIAGIDRCLWARGSMCLGVGSNSLKMVNPDYSTTTLRAGLTPGRDLDYDVMGDRAFYTNGAECGIVQNAASRSWGLERPAVPTATATGGTLIAGEYEFAVTYVRADGQESGTGVAGVITLQGLGVDGGIILSGISVSTDPSVVAKNVYAAPAGSSTLYLRGTIPAAATTFTIAAVQHDANPLQTQFLGAPPAGSCISVFKGWMLVAKDNGLYPSEVYAPELFDYRKRVPFLDRITMLVALNGKTDSVWVGTTSQVILLNGDSPASWEFKVVADYGVIPGTAALADGEVLGDGTGAGEQAVLFATTRGLCLGRANGNFQNLTQARFAYPSMDRGAGLVRRHRGAVQYIASLEGVEVAGNVAA